jgi:hypothetical protein
MWDLRDEIRGNIGASYAAPQARWRDYACDNPASRYAETLRAEPQSTELMLSEALHNRFALVKKVCKRNPQERNAEEIWRIKNTKE